MFHSYGVPFLFLFKILDCLPIFAALKLSNFRAAFAFLFSGRLSLYRGCVRGKKQFPTKKSIKEKERRERRITKAAELKAQEALDHRVISISASALITAVELKTNLQFGNLKHKTISVPRFLE